MTSPSPPSAERNDRVAHLAGARLCVLVPALRSGEDFTRLVEGLAATGVPIIQLRDKRATDRELLERARRLVEVTRRYSALAIVNDRADLAAVSGADGVHVGQDELEVADVRRVAGTGVVVGVSTHSIEQVRAAAAEGADYLGVGPTFPSNTKSFKHFPGLPLCQAAGREIDLPAFAIGGITIANLDRVQGTGMTRIAVGSAVVEAEDPAEAARDLLVRLESVPRDGRSGVKPL